MNPVTKKYNDHHYLFHAISRKPRTSQSLKLCARMPATTTQTRTGGVKTGVRKSGSAFSIRLYAPNCLHRFTPSRHEVPCQLTSGRGWSKSVMRTFTFSLFLNKHRNLQQQKSVIRTFTGMLDGDSLEGAAHIYNECRAKDDFSVERLCKLLNNSTNC